MDNFNPQFPVQEEFSDQSLDQQLSSNPQGIQDQSESQVDQLLPQPAFQIEEEHQHLTQEERDAFSYIFSVRSQKAALLKAKNSMPSNLDTTVLQLHQNKDIFEDNEDVMKALKEWKDETILNWQLVVRNLKYLQKIITKQQLWRQKLTVDFLNELPEAYNLCYNKSLNLSSIERCIVQFSNFHYEQTCNKLEGKISKSNFHLWVYSLLALHQSLASYTNFEALASLNAAFDKEAQYFEVISKDETIDKDHPNQVCLLFGQERMRYCMRPEFDLKFDSNDKVCMVGLRLGQRQYFKLANQCGFADGGIQTEFPKKTPSNCKVISHDFFMILVSDHSIFSFTFSQSLFAILSQSDFRQVPSKLAKMYIRNIMPIQQQALTLPTLSLLSFYPNFSDVFEDHVEEIIKTSQGTCKLSFPFHNDPQFAANTLVKKCQGEYFDCRHYSRYYYNQLILQFFATPFNSNAQKFINSLIFLHKSYGQSFSFCQNYYN